MGTVRQMTPGQAKELSVVLAQAGLTDLTFKQAASLLNREKKAELAAGVRALQQRLAGIGMEIWKTVTLGKHKTLDDLRKALESGGNRVTDWASNILKMVVLAQEKCVVHLVLLTVAELGFEQGATTQEILARARELGLNLCPAEVGPALREQYHDQPVGEWIRVGMEPIAGSGGHPYVFVLGRDGDGRWLYADYAYPSSRWRSDRQWVFASRKQ